jgi:site-specific recombinase XerD
VNIRMAIQNFIAAHKVDNCSPATLENIHYCLGLFATWLESTHKVTDTDDLRVDHLRGWLVYMQEMPTKYGKERRDSSVHTYGVNLKAFCRWLEYEEVIAKPITTRFKLPRVEEPFIPTFTSDDVKKLLAACEEGGLRYKHYPHIRKALTARNRAIVSVLLDTGLRRKELAGLRLGDIDRDLRVLLVHRKGNKWQQVPISWEGFKPLHEYITKHRPHLAKVSGVPSMRKGDAVFLSEDGTPLTAEGVSSLFERLKERAGIDDKRVSPHNCRRYMATTQLAGGRSPLDVQRQMGHTTLTMTNRYASLTIQHLRETHDQHSPLRAKDNDEPKLFGSGYWDE